MSDSPTNLESPPSDGDQHWRRLTDILRGCSPEFLVSRVFPPVGTLKIAESPSAVTDSSDLQESSSESAPPDAAHLSLLELLAYAPASASPSQAQKGRDLNNSLDGLLTQLESFSEMARCPIVAITGMLNSGKSSLLGTYLSPENRRRVLRGLTNEQGTHRYVLWLPRVWWENQELLDTVAEFLRKVFGLPPELLSDDPSIAALQYNGQIRADQLLHPKNAPSSTAQESNANSSVDVSTADPLQVPLLAYDSGLDRLQMGLIDCPDIQSGFTLGGPVAGEALSERRRTSLKSVGRLCSAFVVVSRMNSLHDDSLLLLLRTLRDTMPGVPRLLAVNRVKARYSPEVVYEQAARIVDQFGIQAVYAAYDFRSSFASQRIPAYPRNMQRRSDDESLPIFFQVNRTQQPEHIQYLIDLAGELNAGQLTYESNRSLRIQFKARLLETLEWFTNNEQLNDTRRDDACQALADACYEFMAERDSSGRAIGLRLQASPTIVAQMADSLQKTAPAWMRISLGIDKTARQLHQAISNSASRLAILKSASQSVSGFARRFRRGEGAQVVTPEKLARAIRGADIHNALASVSEADITAGAEAAIKRFAAEDKTQLDERELDEWSKLVWQNMSFREKLWKGTQPLAVMLAPLLAAVLVPIDGGGTAVLVFASTKELLAAAGIAAVMTPMATGGNALKIVQRETPWRQLSDLFAVLCDCIGVPRPALDSMPESMCDGHRRKLLSSNLAVKQSMGEPAFERWPVNQELQQELSLHIQQLVPGPAS